jgi:hypothetical protein
LTQCPSVIRTDGRTGFRRDPRLRNPERRSSQDGQAQRPIYEKLTKVVNEGPGSEDPKLWYSEIDEANQNVKEGGGTLKDDVEL